MTILYGFFKSQKRWIQPQYEQGLLSGFSYYNTHMRFSALLVFPSSDHGFDQIKAHTRVFPYQYDHTPFWDQQLDFYDCDSTVHYLLFADDVDKNK